VPKVDYSKETGGNLLGNISPDQRNNSIKSNGNLEFDQ